MNHRLRILTERSQDRGLAGLRGSGHLGLLGCITPTTAVATFTGDLHCD